MAVSNDDLIHDRNKLSQKCLIEIQPFSGYLEKSSRNEGTETNQISRTKPEHNLTRLSAPVLSKTFQTRMIIADNKNLLKLIEMVLSEGNRCLISLIRVATRFCRAIKLHAGVVGGNFSEHYSGDSEMECFCDITKLVSIEIAKVFFNYPMKPQKQCTNYFRN